jgi:hypothetical protein
MEVVMSQSETIQIEVEAAKALAQWKATFSDEVYRHAKRLASASSRPNLITASHYRQAALSALQSLSAAIADEVGDDVNRTAA